MPFYIVRWPHLQASLIRAQDEDDLVYQLDESGDPGGCKWEIYDGPVWIDFDLPVDITMEQKDRKRPITADELNIDTTTMKKDPWCFDLAEPESSAASDMTRAIRQFAFPALHKLLESTDGEDVESEALNRAIGEDLKPLLEYEWRVGHINRGDDFNSFVMQQLGITAPLPFMKASEEDDDESEE